MGSPNPGRGEADLTFWPTGGEMQALLVCRLRSWKIHDDLLIVGGLDLLEVTSQSGIVFGIEQDEIERH